MKRRITSLITALALSLSLCPTWALAANTLASADLVYKVESDKTVTTPFEAVSEHTFNTREYSYTATKTTAIIVRSGGTLYLKGSAGGAVTSQNGAGVEVETDGTLVVEYPVAVSGTTYGLDAASGANVQLSSGTFTGNTAAIRTADGNFDALLARGYGYFDESGNPISLADVANAKMVVIKGKPTITWGANIPNSVNYTGSAVNEASFPVIVSPADLSEHVAYFYKEQSAADSAYTEGLPTNAGTYNIVARLPELPPNYSAASSEPLTLIINKIPALQTAPTGRTVTYNREPQALATAGVLKEGAVDEGAKIEFARAQSGPYSENIPTETDVSTYTNVWYQVADTENYTGQSGQLSARINHKEITPTVELSYDSTPYDGTEKKPAVTVKDGKDIVPDTEYEVTYINNQDVSTAEKPAKVVVKNKANGNYKIKDPGVTVNFKITPLTQNALSITGKPEVVHYGDTITLSTSGGTGNGAVKWTLLGGSGSTIGEETGILEIKSMGTFTVKAERAVDNYNSVKDSWTFTVQPKPVTAEVTIANKIYDGDNTCGTITVGLKASDVVNNGDSIGITGLTGTFSDPNVGANKTVTLNSSSAIVTDGANKYSVSYPDTATGNITAKEVTPTVTLSGNDLQTDASGEDYYVYDGTAKEPTVTVKDGNDIIPASNYSVSYSGNKNQGTATVTVTAKAGGNYTFADKTVNFTIKQTNAGLTSTPQAKDLTYNGELQDLVTVGTATGGTVVYSLTEMGTYSETIPQEKDADAYTVYYKIEGDSNYAGSDSTKPWSVSVTIKPKPVVNPVITLDQPQTPYVYDGGTKEPGVSKVEDNGKVIPADEYTVTYSNNTNAGTATVMVKNKNGGNYSINESVTFQITKATAQFTTDPGAKTGLKYNGTAQALVTAGTPKGGTAVYSLDGSAYSTTIPTGTNAGSYTVWAKVQGDANHEDSAVQTYTVSIDANQVNNPTIELSSTVFTYNGSEQKPTITVRDDNKNVIPVDSYDVEYDGNTKNVGTYTIKITGKGNYSFTKEAPVEILAADQTALTITGQPSIVYYGDTIQLSTAGGTGSGTVTWKITGAPATDDWITSGGLLTVKGVGNPITVTATRSSSGDNYNTISATWEFRASKKPVTAVLTGVDRGYIADDKSATVKAVVNPSDLVSGDSISINSLLTGEFEDANVGTNKIITITGSSPTVTGTNADKYDISYPATATASIKPIPATVSTVTGKTGLAYTGNPQVLVTTSGTATGGTMVYSLNGTEFSRNIPTAIDAGTYTVYYKAQANDSNHTDSAVSSKTVTIDKQKVTLPQIELTPPSAPYDGSVKQPTVVIVRDTTNHIIPDSEYIVTYEPDTAWIEVGDTYKVKITDISGGNYVITTAEKPFEITAAEQKNSLSITGKPNRVRYGDAPFTLSTTGGSGDGAVTWSSNNDDVATIDEDSGLVTIQNVGTVTITATKAGAPNYADSTATYQFTVEQKPVTVTVTLTLPEGGYTYDRTAKEPTVTVTASDGTVLTGNSDYTVSYSDNINAGTVTVTVTAIGNYAFDTQTKSFTIQKAEATLTKFPQPKNPTYTGAELDLVEAGEAENGTVVYSNAQDGTYTSSIPKGTNAGPYTVWYKVEGNTNYKDIEATGPITVEIYPKTVNTPVITLSGEGITQDSGGTYYYSSGDYSNFKEKFTVKDGETNEVIDQKEYTVVCTLSPEAGPTTIIAEIKDEVGGNYTVTGSITLKIGTAPPSESESPSSSSGGGSGSGSSTSSTTPTTPGGTGTSNSTPSAASAPMQTSVRNGTAMSVMSASAGSELVKQAVASQSKNVIIKPEITGDVTKTEVSIPASTVSQIKSETKADLTVSTPVADVTIPNAALDTLSSAGGTVKAVTEQEENAVTLTLTAGGKTVESVPGGVTLTVPVEDAGPGTVAVLVHDDGTRETIRKSVAGDGEISIPLDGSATVEIVDNSKDFSDVPAENWAAGAVAFASAHELFNGTSATTFSPDQPMSRGMLATVLYRLEGQPDQDQTVTFSDVSSDAWYAAGVSWAAENGITNGNGGGQFAPDQNITREQFAVMLWRYAGSPAADAQELDFTDADKASNYAIDALRWAAANGILNGHGDGRLDPGGLATRAQAAQMLKNFMENT